MAINRFKTGILLGDQSLIAVITSPEYTPVPDLTLKAFKEMNQINPVAVKQWAKVQLGVEMSDEETIVFSCICDRIHDVMLSAYLNREFKREFAMNE